jgi:tRNA (guanine37-N1)-methyltransferase
MIVGRCRCWPTSWMVALAWMHTSRGFSSVLVRRHQAAVLNGIMIGPTTRKRNRFGAFIRRGRRAGGSTSSSGQTPSRHDQDPTTTMAEWSFLSSQQRWIYSGTTSRLFYSSMNDEQYCDPLVAADFLLSTERTSSSSHADDHTSPRGAEDDDEFGSDAVPSASSETQAEPNMGDEEELFLDVDDNEIVAARKLAEGWQDHPSMRQRIDFQSWHVPEGRHVQSILKEAAPHLASRLEFLQHTTGKRRVKIVRSVKEELTVEQRVGGGANDAARLILIHPDAPSLADLLLSANAAADTLAGLIQGGAVTQGPVVPITFTNQDLTVSYILTRLLPPEAHPPPSAFETIGHVAHYNLKRQHLPYRFLIGAVTLSQLRPIIATVIHKVGTVQGPYRTYRYELLAGEDQLHVTHTEASVKLQFDVAAVYWCSRLSEERQRLVQSVFQPHQTIADAFCGVGALCLQAARVKQCMIVANDWNAAAVQALHHNVQLNQMTAHFRSITEMDAYKFLVDLGVKHQSSLPHHVVMNFPLEAPKFLGALRWWPTNADISPRFHVYTFCESADHALRQVAEALVPMTDESVFADDDNLASCRPTVHMVRDVTPNTTVACVSFSATPKLLKIVQGDFS